MPLANAMEIERIPGEVREEIEIVTVETMDQVLREALTRRGQAALGADEPNETDGRFLVS